MLLATSYGGYFGGRLIEQSRGNDFQTLSGPIDS
jgi:hypothetical protein